MTKANKYRIFHLLGEGGFARVYLAVERKTGEKVAIKMTKVPTFVGLEETIYPYWAEVIDLENERIISTKKIDDINIMLRREEELLKKIRHPAFVKVLDKGEALGLYYLVLEYIEGETLAEKMKNGKAIHLNYFVQIIDALIAAKKDGLEYHGDLKPKNIIIAKENQIKIIDPSFQTSPNPFHLITTPLYNPLIEKSDIPSLGIMLYQALTGELPFKDSLLDLTQDASTDKYDTERKDDFLKASKFLFPREVNPDIPKRLENTVLRAIGIKVNKNEIRYEKGYHDLKEIKKDFEDCIRTGINQIQMPKKTAIQNDSDMLDTDEFIFSLDYRC